MFNREFHQKILIVLNKLNASFLAECHAYFGGGTLVSLRHGEHRLSKDIDFMCPIGQGYRQLRQGIFDRGYDALLVNAPEKIIDGLDLLASDFGIEATTRRSSESREEQVPPSYLGIAAEM